jgi:hypothetical protein
LQWTAVQQQLRVRTAFGQLAVKQLITEDSCSAAQSKRINDKQQTARGQLFDKNLKSEEREV